MAEQQRKAPDRPVAERYYAEYVRLPATEGSAQAALQEVLNEKAKRSWQLISVTQGRTSWLSLRREYGPAQRRWLRSLLVVGL